MAELLKLIGVELKDISVLLFLATAIGFLLIILACRMIGRIAPFKQHRKIVWMLDIVLLPTLILSVGLLLNKVIGFEAQDFSKDLRVLSATLLWLVGAWLLTRGLELFLWSTGFKKATGSEPPRLLRGLVTIAIYVLAFYGILTFVFERPVTGLLVSTGIVAGVIGLAMQNVLSDLFAGLAITIENPYSLGDWIELKDGTIGRVLDISWRSTRLLSWNNSIYVVPNNVAASSIIHNYALPDKRYAYWFYVSVASEIPPNTVRHLLLEAALSCKSVLKNPLPIVRIGDVTSQPFKYMVYVYFMDFPSHWAAKSDLFSCVQTSLARSGITPSAIKYEIATRKSPILEVKEPTIEEYLHRVPIFQTLSENEIEELAHSCEIRSFETGEILIQEGDPDSSLFVITSGVVSIIKKNSKGQNIEVSRLGNSECFGEMSLLTGEPRSATAQAITYVEAITVPKEALAALFEIKPDLSNEFAEIMAMRRAQTEGLIDSRTMKSASKSIKLYAKEVVRKIRSFFSLD
jgi:small-conductance mechanosensitive channel/CRP-like cAMP-binding protein